MWQAKEAGDMRQADEAADMLRAAMAELSGSFATATDVTAVLDTVTAHAVELIDAVDFADVLLVDEGRYRSMAPTAELATTLDSIQLDLQEGPCLSAAVEDTVIISSDLTSEQRWPRFAARAAQTGVQSMMSFHLYTYPAKVPGGAGGRGALNLFSHNRYEFTVEEQAVGAMLATHAATALIAADRQTQFESALASRDLIGQAKGILMERFNIDAVRAFGLMTEYSQNANTPVRVVAQLIVDTV